ncbi:helix-turn-helix domain-containing protein [Aliidiomarina sanyensis]|uniref:XRE family transcriptional regulator n=1 Tax=Aliidiomarina sanyensis TaxID=1249555 RepID=A0A432W543_9GAMM|nr:helix-turn-helix transcriptional regulator [Aliidiomarina sanyensis]RUO25162.1 XRE family transcriptional regulator [Aliidiomarina sanyensis]
MSKTIYNSKYQALVQELANERIRLNISQGELATQVGLNQSDISKIEKFERRLDVLEFALLLKALRITENSRLQAIVSEFTGVPHG